jgi:cytochrome c-type biogenesis protein CcmE
MNPRRRQKLLGIGLIFLLIALAVGLVLYALQQNINLFYTPTQVVQGLAPLDHGFRLGGYVSPNSLRKDPHSLKVDFLVTDKVHAIPVQYTGVLPDLFREGQSVVVDGQLNAKRQFIAVQVLAKHDERYMPKAVQDLLLQQKKSAQNLRD